MKKQEEKKEKSFEDLAIIQQKPEFLVLKSNIEQAVEESKKIIVFAEEDVEKAGFYIKNFKQLEKRIEDYRKDIVKPVNDEVKKINTFFKKLAEMFLPEQNRLLKESNEILREIRERQEQERLAEQKELEDTILDEAEMFNDITVIDQIPQVEFKQQKVQSDNLTTVRTKKWRITDFDAIPKEYLTVNDLLVNELRKDYDFESKSPINGIAFYFDENLRVK
jgi:hypothetical protein